MVDSESARAGGEPTQCDLTLETADGDLAATVTITGLGHEHSPAIVGEIERAIRDELDHLVRDHA